MRFEWGFERHICGPPLVTTFRKVDAGQGLQRETQSAEVWYVMAGLGSVVLDGEPHPVWRGDAVEIQQGVAYTITASSEGEGLALLVVAQGWFD